MLPFIHPYFLRFVHFSISIAACTVEIIIYIEFYLFEIYFHLIKHALKNGRHREKQEKTTAAFTKRLQKEFILNEKTVAVLLDKEVDSFEALGTLTEDTISSPEFGLSVGQAGLLKRL